MSKAVDIYLHELKLTKIFCKLFGFDIWTEIFQPNVMTYLVPLDVSIYHLGQIYSAYYYRDDFYLLVLSLVTWNYAFQVVKKSIKPFKESNFSFF